LWQASRRIRIGITCSGTPGSARRLVTARPAARPLSEIGCRTREKARIAALIPPDIAEQIPLDLLGLITDLPAEMAQIPWDGPQVRIIEHQAHAPGHAALLIEERGVLVAGDMLCDVLIPMLDLNDTADPIEDYLATLRLLEGAADDVDVLVPGHGSIGGADDCARGVGTSSSPGRVRRTSSSVAPQQECEGRRRRPGAK
jgi:glyoxylase-like metal-dependent hydrolase (beta-lactamase superfamily II)